MLESVSDGQFEECKIVFKSLNFWNPKEGEKMTFLPKFVLLIFREIQIFRETNHIFGISRSRALK